MINWLDMSFIEEIRNSITPFQPLSATENIAPLLYVLIRMQRPRTVVEYGSGYTTPFILKALEDNLKDFTEYKNRIKKNAKKYKQTLSASERAGMSCDEWLIDEVTKKVYGGEPILPIPSYYHNSYDPVLYTFDVLPPNNEYIQKLNNLVKNLGLEKYFVLNAGATLKNYTKSISRQHFPIDMAWNDFGNKERFVKETYSALNGNGGIMMLHNTINGEKEFRQDIDKIFESMREDDIYDLESLNLLEPHKFTQRSCTILRKVSDCKESYWKDTKNEMDKGLKILSSEPNREFP